MVNKSKAAVKAESAKEPTEPPARKTRSPARPKSPTRRSPARTKSPGRTKSPARKSPSRNKIEAAPLKSSTPKARSPIRKSPTRTTRERKSSKSPTRTTRVTKSTEFEKIQRPRRGVIEIDSDSDPDGFLPLEKPQAAVRGRARRLEIQVEKLPEKQSTFSIVKRMTHSQSREVERVVHLRNFDKEKIVQKLGEFSDEDDVQRKSVEKSADFQPITEFGGPLGALFFTLFIPLSVLLLLISCNEYQCSFVKIPLYTQYLSWSGYFDLTAILGFTAYAVLLAILSVIPFGGKQVAGLPTKQGKFTYVMNGLFSCLVFTLIGIGLELKKVQISEYIVNHLFHLLIASFLFGLLLTIYAFIRSFYVPFSHLNAHVGRSKIYGFFMGRELNPRIFNLLDLKMYVFRLALIGSVLLDFAYLYTSLNWTSTPQNGFDLKSIKINPTVLTLVLMHSIYYLDALAHETAFVTSFEIQYEGFGYMSGVGYLIYPFMMATVTKYVVDYHVRLAVWKLGLISLVFLFGYLLFRGSNNQKDAFRKNPYDPALSHLDTIPTTKGKKLICSGFWGVVRHPNYLGDILMNCAFVPFAYQVPPALSAVSIVLLLVHRSVRDNVRCKQKYGSAWERYCHKVKYVLIPKIY